MLNLYPPKPSLYFLSIIYRYDIIELKNLRTELEKNFCLANQSFSPRFNPSIDYYSKEMGTELQRVIILESHLRSRSELVPLKHIAQNFEQQFQFSLVQSSLQQRLVNIDVGQINLENMILATTKPYAHRIYMNSGIYSELCYQFQGKSYTGLPWTYPDYLCPEKIDYFNSAREKLK